MYTIMKPAFFFEERSFLKPAVREDMGFQVHAINMGEYLAESCVHSQMWHDMHCCSDPYIFFLCWDNHILPRQHSHQEEDRAGNS